MSSDSDPASQPTALDQAGMDADSMGGDPTDPAAPCSAIPKGPLWVRLDLTPDEAANATGSLRLQGSGYDSTLAIAGSFEANADPDNTVDIVFEAVPIQGSYTLTYSANGQQFVLAQRAAYASLQDDSLPPPPEEDAGDAPPEQPA